MGWSKPAGSCGFEFDEDPAAVGVPALAGSSGEPPGQPLCRSRDSSRRRRRPAERGRRLHFARTDASSGDGTGRGRPACPRRPNGTAPRWPPPVPTRKAASNWPSCSIARAIWAAAASATTWPSSWTKTTSRPARTWAACWAKLGQRDLAAAAFEGALRYHPDYADAHYHLARTLDEMGHRRTAEQHWRRFLSLRAGQSLGGGGGRTAGLITSPRNSPSFPARRSSSRPSCRPATRRSSRRRGRRLP